MHELEWSNPADVVYNGFWQAFFPGMVKMFQQDNEMRHIVMTDKDARERAHGTSSSGRSDRREDSDEGTEHC